VGHSQSHSVDGVPFALPTPFGTKFNFISFYFIIYSIIPVGFWLYWILNAVVVVVVVDYCFFVMNNLWFLFA
jgi:hypothetical protein